MLKNAIESDFRSSKMGGGGGGITMASLWTIRGCTQYLPLGKYTNSSLWYDIGLV